MILQKLGVSNCSGALASPSRSHRQAQALKDLDFLRIRLTFHYIPTFEIWTTTVAEPDKD